MKPIDASKKVKAKPLFSNLPDKKEKYNLRFQWGQLVRTADINEVSRKGDSTKWCYKLNTFTKVIHDTLRSCVSSNQLFTRDS